MTVNAVAEIILNPLMPIWLLACCFVVFAVLVWLTYSRCVLTPFRRIALFALRLGAFLLLCIALVQPVNRHVSKQSEKPIAAVLIDGSASMSDVVRGNALSRGERAKVFLNSSRFMNHLKKMCTVRYYRFGESCQICNDESDAISAFDAGQSRLFDSLQEIFKSGAQHEQPAVVVLLSDGLDTSGKSLADMRLNTPVITVELEDQVNAESENGSDYSVSIPDNSRMRRTTKGWKTTVIANIQRLSGNQKTDIPVRLMKGAEVLETHYVQFDETATYAQTQFEFTPDETGSFVYRVEIIPSEDENTNNNHADIALDVVDESNRVLFLEGVPRPDFRFFKRALMREKSFNTSVYLKLGTGEFMNFEEMGEERQSLADLLKEDSLKRFKVLILGEFTSDSFTSEQIKSIRSFVESGGGLLFAGGVKAYGANGYLTPKCLGEISPVRCDSTAMMHEETPVPVSFSLAGRSENAFLKLATEAEFSPIQSIWSPVTLTGGATAILESTGGEPLLVSRRYGLGRVTIILSNTLYNLRLKTGTLSGNSVYDRLVSQTVTWMLPNQDAIEKGDSLQLIMRSEAVDVKQNIHIGVLTSASCKPEELQCQVTTPDGKTVQYPMVAKTLGENVGLSKPQAGFESEMAFTAAGTYMMQILKNDGTKSEQKSLVVREPYQEHTGEPINRDLLEKMAEESKGKWIIAAEQDDDTIINKLKIVPRIRENMTERTLWHSWFLIIPIILLLCIEWTLRRRWELV